MFIYPIYPVPRRQKKKTARQVEPVSRIKPIRRVEYNSDPDPLQRIRNIHKIADSQSRMFDKIYVKDRSENGSKQDVGEQPTGELYIRHALPLLLEWRYPRIAISPDYIQKHHDRLVAVKLKHCRQNHIILNTNKKHE